MPKKRLSKKHIKKNRKTYKRKHNTKKFYKRKGGDIPIDIPNEKQKMLNRLQQLMLLNQTNQQRYQELDDRLYDIEQMNPNIRQQHQDEYNQLENEIQQLRESNNESQREFEQLRQQYMSQYMSTTQA
jgi:hypothetical protein